MEGKSPSRWIGWAVPVVVLAAGCSTLPTAAPLVEAAAPASTPADTAGPAPTTTLPAATTTTAADPAAELAEAEARAADSRCGTQNATRQVLATLDGADPGFERMGLYTSEMEGKTEVRTLYPATVGYAVEGDFVPYASDEDLALSHAKLHFNHLRVVQLSQQFIGEDPLEVVVEGSHGPMLDRSDEPAVAATWDGHTITLADGRTAPFRYGDLVRPPEPDLVVSDEARELAWEEVGAWVAQLDGFLWSGDARMTADLEVVESADEVARTLCVLLATEYDRVEAKYDHPSLVNAFTLPGALFSELAAQELLLATEYLAEVERHLAEPDIDWWRGTVDDSILFGDGTTSDVEYVWLFHQAALSAIAEYRGIEAAAELMP